MSRLVYVPPNDPVATCDGWVLDHSEELLIRCAALQAAATLGAALIEALQFEGAMSLIEDTALRFETHLRGVRK